MNASSLSDDLKKDYTAQASFIRGLCYYYLSMMWGDVPLRIDPSTSDAVSLSKSPFTKVVEQIFIDWNYAYDNLPEGGEHLDGYIDKLGVAVRTGHHCAQPLMTSLGIEGTVRVSFAVYNTQAEADAFIAALKRVVQMFR